MRFARIAGLVCSRTLRGMLCTLPFGVERSVCGLSPTIRDGISRVHLQRGLPLTLAISNRAMFLGAGKRAYFSLRGNVVGIDGGSVARYFLGLYRGSIFTRRGRLHRNFVMVHCNNHTNIYNGFDGNNAIASVDSLGLEVDHRIGNYTSGLLDRCSNNKLLVTKPPTDNGAALLHSLVHGLSGKSCKGVCHYSIVSAEYRVSNKNGLSLNVTASVVIARRGPSKVRGTLHAVFPSVVTFSRVNAVSRLGTIDRDFFSNIGVVAATRVRDIFSLGDQRVAHQLLRDNTVTRITMLPGVVNKGTAVVPMGRVLGGITIWGGKTCFGFNHLRHLKLFGNALPWDRD